MSEPAFLRKSFHGVAYDIVCRHASGICITIETAKDRRHAVKRVLKLMADPAKPPFAVVYAKPRAI